jgi:hypothetical protein
MTTVELSKEQVEALIEEWKYSERHGSLFTAEHIAKANDFLEGITQEHVHGFLRELKDGTRCPHCGEISDLGGVCSSCLISMRED